MSPPRNNIIPDFEGEVYDRNCRAFESKRWQYATSTYGKKMKPKYIAYPKNESDVQVAIKYAKKKELKVMARSGGHQYCGVSCDTDALILSMDNFKHRKLKNVKGGFTAMGPDGKNQTVYKVVNVGVGNRLEHIVEFFKKEGITVPHGECPSVGIGGHTQTGGYGHLMRSFGLCIDYVYGFTIVTADGKIQEVNRESMDETERDLYYATLGGSQGAFGVTTNIVFHPILDRDYPASTGLLNYRLYSQDEAKKCLKIFKNFTDRCKDDLPDGIDMMFSIGTNNTSLKADLLDLRPSVVIFEMVCKDSDDTSAYEAFNSFKNDFETNTRLTSIGERTKNVLFRSRMSASGIGRLRGDRHYPLSKINEVFTRKSPLVIYDGESNSSRESLHPYIKATYGGNDKLSDTFVDDFVNLINDVNEQKSLQLVVQGGAGGGAYKRHAGKTACPQRDTRYFITFDIFRKNTSEQRALAKKFHKRFITEIVEKHFANNPKKMLQWAPSHKYLNMKRKKVWEMYYDNHDDYRRLREIKYKVDRDDLFHSRITIPPRAKNRKAEEEETRNDLVRAKSDSVRTVHLQIEKRKAEEKTHNNLVRSKSCPLQTGHLQTKKRKAEEKTLNDLSPVPVRVKRVKSH